MAFFDLHCDTVYECTLQGQALWENRLALSLSKGRGLGRWCQVFALFLPDRYRGREAVAFYERLLGTYRTELTVNAETIAPCHDASQILGAVGQGKCAAVLSVENGSALGGDLSRVDTLYNDGVRMMALTWNGDNELASGVGGSGGGLTELGKQAVRKMTALGMLCDVSHLNERGFWELHDMGVKPLVASHSNLKAVCPHRRNLTDDQFRAVCRSGGVMGVNFYRDFLGGDARERIYANISYALDLGGEDAVAFGSDFDGAEMDFHVNSVDKMNNLCDYLLSKGLSQRVLNKLCFDNALRLFRKEEYPCSTTVPATTA